MTLPAGLALDRPSRVLIRGERAARLSPAQTAVLADLIAAGGAAPVDRMSPELSLVAIHDAVRTLNTTVDRLHLAVARSRGTVFLFDTGAGE